MDAYSNRVTTMNLSYQVTIPLGRQILLTPLTSACERGGRKGRGYDLVDAYTTFRRIKMRQVRAAAATRKKGQTEASASIYPSDFHKCLSFSISLSLPLSLSPSTHECKVDGV